MLIRAEIKAGICNLRTTIEADSSDGMTAHLQITSDCPQVRALAEELGVVEVYQELFRPVGETGVLKAAAKCRLHTTCVVPVGILKAIEAAAGLALPAESCITLSSQRKD